MMNYDAIFNALGEDLFNLGSGAIATERATLRRCERAVCVCALGRAGEDKEDLQVRLLHEE